MNEQLDPNKPVDLKLTLGVVGVIQHALGQLPYQQVKGIIEGVEAQVVAQLQPPADAPAD